MPTPEAIEAAWQRFRAAILRRMEDPTPENYAEQRRLRDELVALTGEAPIGSNVVAIAPRRRAA